MTDARATDLPSESARPSFRVPGVSLTPADAQRIANTTAEYGWYSPIDRIMVPIAPSVAWANPEFGPSTIQALHEWEPLDALLTAHANAPESTELDAAVAFAHDWLDLALQPSDPGIGIAGRRAIRLGYLANAAGDDRLEAAAVALEDALLKQIDPTDVSMDTTDAIVGALILETEGAEGLLVAHLGAVFTDDGIHRSQAPGDQQRVIDRLTMVLDAEYTTAVEVIEVRQRAEHALAWFIAPDGIPANFGNSPSTPISSAYDPKPSGLRFLSDRIADPALLHAASGGRFGKHPDVNRKIFHDGGFMVIKEPWPSRAEDAPPASHLVMRTGPPAGGTGVDAGLAVTLHEHGRSLIVEPGPGPPGSTHPAADYADHAEAHNRVVVGPLLADDDAPATAPPRQSAPLAGGLQRWGLMEGHYFCDSYESTGDMHHRRSVMYEPGSWLLIADVTDPIGRRSVGPRFHAAPRLDVIAADNRFTMVDELRPVAWAVALGGQPAVAPQRGLLEPRPSGWWSPDGSRMMPNWVFGWDDDGPSTFVTLFAVDERPAVDQPQGAWFGWHTARYQARVAVTEWGIVDIDIQRTHEEKG